jgi:hypothetical protein
MQVAKVFRFCVVTAVVAPAPIASWRPVRAEPPRPLVFVITGESNSGGLGLNADATPDERAPRQALLVLDLQAADRRFVPLHLGHNNLRRHTRLEDYEDTCHGLENQLANAAAKGRFPGHSHVYLVKTGHGGSKIAEWQPDAATGYWKEFVARTDAARKQLQCEPQWVVWMSLGINDAIAGTPGDVWQSQMADHLRCIPRQLPGARIVLTEFQAMGYPEINRRIRMLAAEVPGVASVDTTGIPLRDQNHWGYAGLKMVADRLIEASLPAR